MNLNVQQICYFFPIKKYIILKTVSRKSFKEVSLLNSQGQNCAIHVTS